MHRVVGEPTASDNAQINVFGILFWRLTSRAQPKVISRSQKVTGASKCPISQVPLPFAHDRMYYQYTPCTGPRVHCAERTWQADFTTCQHCWSVLFQLFVEAAVRPQLFYVTNFVWTDSYYHSMNVISMPWLFDTRRVAGLLGFREKGVSLSNRFSCSLNYNTGIIFNSSVHRQSWEPGGSDGVSRIEAGNPQGGGNGRRAAGLV